MYSHSLTVRNILAFKTLIMETNKCMESAKRVILWKCIYDKIISSDTEAKIPQ